MLSYPLPHWRFILDTDASKVGIGGMLTREQLSRVQAGAKLLRDKNGTSGSHQGHRALLLVSKVPVRNRPRGSSMVTGV